MIYTGYTESDNYYELTGENGEVLLVPKANTIVVDDESDVLSIKGIASRQTIALVRKSE